MVNHVTTPNTTTPLAVEALPLAEIDFETLLSTFHLTFSEKATEFKLHYEWVPIKAYLKNGVYNIDNVTVAEHALVDAAARRLQWWLYLYDEMAVSYAEAVSRMPLDQVLREAIAIVDGHAARFKARFSSQGDYGNTQQPPPETPNNHIQLFADVQLKYIPGRSPLPPANSELSCDAPNSEPTTTSPPTKQYTGHIDYCIGHRQVSPRTTQPLTSAINTCHLTIVKAKTPNAIYHARSQVLANIACLYYARLSAGARGDCATYGIASDGYQWIFVKITHGGVVRFSDIHDVRRLGWQVILGCIIVMAKEAMALQSLDSPRSLAQGGRAGAAEHIVTVGDDAQWLLEAPSVAARGEAVFRDMMDD